MGVVEGESAGLVGDFRASESLFQLITQVAGRAGRAGTKGVVIVQTTMPDLPALRCAVRHDYESFVSDELAMRRTHGLPPFSRLTRIVLTHEREDTCRSQAEALVGRVEEAITRQGIESACVHGPDACPLPRLRGKYRYDLQIQSATASAMRDLLAHLGESGGLRGGKASVMVDVDPVAFG